MRSASLPMHEVILDGGGRGGAGCSVGGELPGIWYAGCGAAGRHRGGRGVSRAQDEDGEERRKGGRRNSSQAVELFNWLFSLLLASGSGWPDRKWSGEAWRAARNATSALRVGNARNWGSRRGARRDSGSRWRLRGARQSALPVQRRRLAARGPCFQRPVVRAGPVGAGGGRRAA